MSRKCKCRKCKRKRKKRRRRAHKRQAAMMSSTLSPPRHQEFRSCHFDAQADSERTMVAASQGPMGPDVVHFVHGIFDASRPLGVIVDAENKRCQLSGARTWPVHAHLSKTSDAIMRLFETVTRLVPGCRLSSVDLFHCHVILLVDSDIRKDQHALCDWRHIALLFHAFEYPSDAGVNLGFCQRNRGASDISVRHPSFQKRNVLCTFARNDPASADMVILTVLPGGHGGLSTRYAEEFGFELGEIVLAELASHAPFPVLYPIRSGLFAAAS